MRKLISLMLCVAMFMSMFVFTTVSANETAVASENTVASEKVYKAIDLSPYANGKFWVDTNDSSEYTTSQYGRTDFVSGDGVEKMAVQWPLSFRDGQYREGNPSYGSTYPEQKSIISGNTTDGFKMTSKLTGVTYNMPRKTESVSEKEAIILNREGAVANWGGNGEMIKEKTIYVSGNYDKLHFIVATAMRDSGTASIDATVTYTDGTTSVLKSADIPSSCNTAQAASANFFADVWTAGSANSSTDLNNYYNGNYSIYYILAMYEYSLELDSDKTVESIHFATDRTVVTPSIAIPAVTLEGVKSKISRAYNTLELSPYANGKFWVDTNDSSEYTTSQYGRTDFVSGDGVEKMAVQWPLKFRDGQYRDGNPSYGSTYPEQKSIIRGNTTDGFKMTSKTTGIPYKMPRKTESVSEKEAIILNREGAAANWGGNGEMIKEKTIYVSGKYDKLHFIVATAKRDSGTTSIDATVTYTDGTTSVLKSANIPSSCNTAQAASANFFADVWTAGSANSTTNLSNTYNANYSIYYILAMYEYSLELDSDKTVESIHFTTDRTVVTPSIAIPAVTLEGDISQIMEYESVNISKEANGKFWVDTNDSSEYTTSQYGRTDFVSGDGVEKMAVQWPLSFRGGQYRDGNPSYGSTYPEQKSIISGNTTDGFKMTSKLTGVTYNMPRKTESVSEKEAIILNREGAAANWGGNGEMIKEKTIYVSGKYDKLHFIVATAMRDSGTASIDATVTYTDGTTSVLKSADIPSSCNTAQAASANFFADVWTAGSANSSTDLNNYYNGNYSIYYILAMYEYSLELDSDKTVESIHFTTDRTVVTPSIAIPAITLAKHKEDNLIAVEPFGFSNVSVNDGTVSVDVYAPNCGTAILAVYDTPNKGRLVASGSVDFSDGSYGKKVTAESSEIVSGGSYYALIMLWDSINGMTPIYHAIPLILD